MVFGTCFLTTCLLGLFCSGVSLAQMGVTADIQIVGFRVEMESDADTHTGVEGKVEVGQGTVIWADSPIVLRLYGMYVTILKL